MSLPLSHLCLRLHLTSPTSPTQSNQIQPNPTIAPPPTMRHPTKSDQIRPNPSDSFGSFPTGFKTRGKFGAILTFEAGVPSLPQMKVVRYTDADFSQKITQFAASSCLFYPVIDELTRAILDQLRTKSDAAL